MCVCVCVFCRGDTNEQVWEFDVDAPVSDGTMKRRLSSSSSSSSSSSESLDVSDGMCTCALYKSLIHHSPSHLLTLIIDPFIHKLGQSVSCIYVFP